MKSRVDYWRVTQAVRDPAVATMDTPAFKAVGLFLRSPLVQINPNFPTRLKDVYLRYVDWCELYGWDRVGKINFNFAVSLTGQVEETIKGPGRQRHLGIRILEVEHPDWYWTNQKS